MALDRRTSRQLREVLGRRGEEPMHPQKLDHRNNHWSRLRSVDRRNTDLGRFWDDWWLCEKLIQISSQISSRTDSDQLELTQISLNWLRSVLYSAKPMPKRSPKLINVWIFFWHWHRCQGLWALWQCHRCPYWDIINIQRSQVSHP